MSDNPDDTSTSKEIEELKAKLAEFEKGKDDKNFEIRFTKSQEKVTELTESLRGLTSTIGDLEAANKARELKAAESSGDLKSVVELKDREIQTAQADLLKAKLDVDRIVIGLRNKLPLEIARILPGDDGDSIEASAVTIRASYTQGAGFSDARQSGGVIVTGNGPKKPKTNYVPVRPDGAF